MGTLSRYLLLRATGRFALLLVVFLGIIAGGQVALAINKGVPPDALGPALLGMCLLAMPLALPLALTTAVLVTMGGLQRDGELRALAASGIAPASVAARLAPLIAVGVVASAVLSHLVLPQAMLSFRENAGRFAQAAVVYRVSSQYSILNEAQTKVYARAATGTELEDIYLFGNTQNGEVVVHADGAHWYLGRSGANEGMGLDLHGVTMIRSDHDGGVMVAQNPNSIHYPVFNQVAKNGADAEADTWSTAKLIDTVHDWKPGQSLPTFNNARLNLQLRLFMPVAVVMFAIFAAGLALTLGAADMLTGVLIVVVTVAVTTLPAIQYVKTSVNYPLRNPGWLLWPPGIFLFAIGLWMLVRPDHARELFAKPLIWLSQLIKIAVSGARFIYLNVILRQRAINNLAEQVAPATRVLLPRGLSVLDRYVLLRTITRWLAVLAIGTFLLLLGEFMGKSSYYLRCFAHQPVLFIQFFLLRIPEFLAMWLPLSLGVSGMLVAAPMLRQGALVALAAAGVAQSRAFAALIPFALLVGVLGVVVDDQVMPRVRPLIDDTEDRMNMDTPAPSSQLRPAGWRSGEVFWTALRAQPSLGIFNHVAIFDGRPGHLIAAQAERLEWQENGWHLRNLVICSPIGLRRLADAKLADAGLELDFSRRSLALELRTDQTKTSNQLLRQASPHAWATIASRFIWIISPLACLAMVLPLFTRWESRLRLGTVSAKAAVLLIVPMFLLAGMQRMLLTSEGSPVVLGLVTILALAALAGWRWLRMRV